MSAVDAQPNAVKVDPCIWVEDDNKRKEKLLEISQEIVEKYVDFRTDFSELPSTKKGTIHTYACETLSLCLLLQELRDAIREGDGNRVMVVWKYLFPIFKATGHKNYSIEAFTLLCQYYFILPPQLAEQLKWSRFINTHGTRGTNISMDLHIEHLNRLCKTAINGLGANKSQKAIIRVGKTVGVMDDLMDNFDSVNDVAVTSDKHTSTSMEKDLKIVLTELQEIRAFKATSDKFIAPLKICLQI